MTPGWIDTLFYYAYDITKPTYNKMMNPDLFLGGPHSICTPVLVRGTSEQVTLIFFSGDDGRTMLSKILFAKELFD